MIALTAGPELYSSEVDGISATVLQPEQLVAVSRAVENSQKAIRSAVNVQTARAARRRRAKAEFIVSLDTMDEYTTAECSHSICPSLKRLLPFFTRLLACEINVLPNSYGDRRDALQIRSYRAAPLKLLSIEPFSDFVGLHVDTDAPLVAQAVLEPVFLCTCQSLLRRKKALRNRERAQPCVTVFESHAPKRAALLSASGLQANRIGLVKNCWRSLPCAYAALSSLLLCWRAFLPRQSMPRAFSDSCRGPG